jgi:hypothetical protein
MTRRFALLLMLAIPAWPCSCSGNWPSVKQAWKESPFVFLGTVEIANPDGDGPQSMFQEQSVRIHIDDAFKGVAAGQTIDLNEGANDCAAKFSSGQRAVFYLNRDATTGSWYVPPCTHSIASAAEAGDDLLFLRKLPQSARGTRLSGEVELYEDLPAAPFHRVAGLSGVRVTISGPKESTTEVVTNAEGVYELYGLPPGRYFAKLSVPTGLKIDFPLTTGSAPVRGNESAVELEANGGAGVSFVLKADTRLAGRVLDASGKPVTGACLYLEPVEGRGEGGAFLGCSKKGGDFAMTMMPPGQYVLVARDQVRLDDHKSESTLYYPGARTRDKAAIVSVEAGKYVENLDIQLPPNEKRYRITGRMQFQDGAPVADSSVTFASTQGGYAEKTLTDADGSFGFLVIAGMQGELRGETGVLASILEACPQFQVSPQAKGIFRVMDASPIPLTSDSDHENVKLRLPFASCKALHTRR